MEGKPVPVDPDPVFVIEDSGPEAFLDDMDADDMDAAITGRQAGPEEERQDLPVAFIPPADLSVGGQAHTAAGGKGWQLWRTFSRYLIGGTA